MSAELVLALAQIVLALVVVAVAGLALRRRVIVRRGGIVECCLRSATSGRWQHGLAEYRHGQLYWHRSLSLSVRPQAAFDRRQLVVTASRPARDVDASWLGPGTMIVTCEVQRSRTRPPRALSEPVGRCAAACFVDLAMSQAALTGFLAWREAAPAGYVSEAG
jgi:hypothetical protein